MSPLEETIAKAVEQRADRIVETLCDIVRFPSIVKSDPREAGPGERDCQLYLQKRLEALGFTTDLWDPDGPALYYTVLAPAIRGQEIEQWASIKAAVSEALLAGEATITHHHAVGRDHRPWYDRQRPDPFAAALRGAKAALDPRGIMNPGVLIDPASPTEAR